MNAPIRVIDPLSYAGGFKSDMGNRHNLDLTSILRSKTFQTVRAPSSNINQRLFLICPLYRVINLVKGIYSTVTVKSPFPRFVIVFLHFNNLRYSYFPILKAQRDCSNVAVIPKCRLKLLDLETFRRIEHRGAARFNVLKLIPYLGSK